MAAVSEQTVMAIKSYQNQAQVLVKNYLIAEPFIPYTSILAGLLACKMVYDLTQLISTFYFKTYNGLSKGQRMEWNNRGISTIHAIFITAMSLYFLLWSDLFSDRQRIGLITLRSSWLSNLGLGVSVGYFLADLGMIFWLYPSLGGIEYNLPKTSDEDKIEKPNWLYKRVNMKVSFAVIHHSLSGIAVAYSMFSGEGQLYTYMVLLSEVTTPEINMRWYLDTAGMKRSSAYLMNGVIIFFAWLFARILLFGYLFYHVYLHYDQVIQMHAIGYLLVFVVPSALGIMNLMWFGRILKGLKKTLAKRQ